MRKLFFGIISLSSFLIAICFSFLFENPLHMMTGIWLLFSILAYFIGWPENIVSLNFMGFELKLKRVERALKELNLLAETNSRVLLELVQGSKRWGDYPDSFKDGVYEDVEKVLKSLGFQDEKIKNIQAPWHS